MHGKLPNATARNPQRTPICAHALADESRGIRVFPVDGAQARTKRNAPDTPRRRGNRRNRATHPHRLSGFIRLYRSRIDR
ncbi:hypothetical protein WT60_18355 [Burkholderia sp. MSMB617WGS]|nr:hypothetical protein WT60_18355 [Burkholderia sp. MSMB617WGS]